MGMHAISIARALLAHLRSQDIHLSSTPDGLLHVRPASALDAHMCSAIAQHKHALM